MVGSYKLLTGFAERPPLLPFRHDLRSWGLGHITRLFTGTSEIQCFYH